MMKIAKTKENEKEIAKVAGKVVKRALRNENNVEVKRHRFIHSAALVAATTVYNNLLTANAQGLGDLNVRGGDRIKLRDIKINITVAPSAANEICRVILFYWKPLSSVAPTDADIFDDTTTSIHMLLGEVDFDAKASGNVFTILYDRFFMVSSVEGPKTLVIKKKLNKAIQYDAAGTHALGAPYLALLSNSTPTIRAYSVVRYTDL